MPNMINLIIRATALLWTLLITALIGNVIASNIDAAGSAMAAVNFTMFVAVVSWIVCIYAIAASFVSALGSPIVMLPLDAFAVLFTLIDAIVLSAKLRAVNCANIGARHFASSWIAFGSADDEKRCREIQASTVFMWFLFISLAAGLFFTFKDSRGGGLTGSVRSSRPNMSQVSA
ncbi:membrane-associating domain-containing protein [Hirsutella rhossiliensis]|uniref:Membrane-associating domain-containing protein n=1 Tax=Hirsutella rhossiliensis TaxID=111463 RepID=A0A9P8MMZ5_9HYPO|nr:membrane-associating domain-containing protein [Hirsutella rhossiliensis]KAH0958358.1 membrane-associating domain-containing protein [Hirsutella rhossiliensis]